MLLLQKFKKVYITEPVLMIGSLQLPSGVYWLQGKNGAGKTTLFKAIAGLIPFEGEIQVDNISLRKQRRLYTKAVSIAEAEPVFPAFLSGSDLLQFYLETKGGTRQASLDMAERLGIDAHLAQPVSTYSSGMLKKLSLLLALTGDPKLVLLDEPLSTLDAVTVAVLRDIIVERATAGVSFLVSSHQELELSMLVKRLRIHHQTLEEDVHDPVA